MESPPTLAPPIHANNQAMQHMAYFQWHQHLVFHSDSLIHQHYLGLKAYLTTMHLYTRHSSFIPTLSFHDC